MVTIERPSSIHADHTERTVVMALVGGSGAHDRRFGAGGAPVVSPPFPLPTDISSSFLVSEEEYFTPPFRSDDTGHRGRARGEEAGIWCVDGACRFLCPAVVYSDPLHPQVLAPHAFLWPRWAFRLNRDF